MIVVIFSLHQLQMCHCFSSFRRPNNNSIKKFRYFHKMFKMNSHKLRQIIYSVHKGTKNYKISLHPIVRLCMQTIVGNEMRTEKRCCGKSNKRLDLTMFLFFVAINVNVDYDAIRINWPFNVFLCCFEVENSIRNSSKLVFRNLILYGSLMQTKNIYHAPRQNMTQIAWIDRSVLPVNKNVRAKTSLIPLCCLTKRFIGFIIL